MNRQDKAPTAAVKRKWNWRIWTGFLFALIAIPGYFLFLARFPITRDVPWVSWLMFAVAGWLLWVGVGRAFANSWVYRGKIAGPILAVVSLGAAGFFPGEAIRLHESFEDPAAAASQEQPAAFRRVRDQLESWLQEFANQHRIPAALTIR